MRAWPAEWAKARAIRPERGLIAERGELGAGNNAPKGRYIWAWPAEWAATGRFTLPTGEKEGYSPRSIDLGGCPFFVNSLFV
ncbi:hypothetical protein ASG89_15000 [Paenibacillus sp. Soil766]|nr:hypothetical protein ASG89_15000 [Paenibacillus sp. Soil766]